MTVTKDQAQMLATLARACRPNGARRWDSAGVMAAIEQVKARSLPEVIMATIRAACDANADTPGVIPKPGPHWQEAKAVAPPSALNVMDPGERCTACGKPDDAAHPKDHPFYRRDEVPDYDAHAIAEAIRPTLAKTPEVAERPSLDELADTPRVRALKTEMAAAVERAAAAEVTEEVDERASA